MNKNAVPKDPQSPFVTSGIHIGTPVLLERVRGQVGDLCATFPVYAD